MSKETADILRAARAKIERPECWGQEYYERSGRLCMMGAIMYTDGVTGEQEEACRAALRDATGDASIGHWNDKPDRTHAEVLAAFDRAIAAEEA